MVLKHNVVLLCDGLDNKQLGWKEGTKKLMNEEPKSSFFRRHWFLIAVLISAAVWFTIAGVLTHWQFQYSTL